MTGCPVDSMPGCASILDHGINVEEEPEPVRLAERGQA
jgi:hypothetical protein